MAYIYKISNDINNKIYIGMTTRTIQIRWKEHLRHNSQLIDIIIHQFGPEHFKIEEIERCAEEEVDDREIYWIKFYDSYKNGYNITAGGRDNKVVATDKVDLVLQLWKEGLTINRIVEETKLNVETVRNYLNKNGIDHNQIKQRANIFIGKAKSIPIGQYDLENNLIQIWDSQAQICREKGYAQSSLGRAIKYKRILDNSYWRKVNR